MKSDFLSVRSVHLATSGGVVISSERCRDRRDQGSALERAAGSGFRAISPKKAPRYSWMGQLEAQERKHVNG